MLNNSRFPQRDVTSRAPGPSVFAAGDGLEGAYAAHLHTAPSGGSCKVVIPALDTINSRDAICSTTFTGHVGDLVLVVFDENKEPWIVATAA